MNKSLIFRWAIFLTLSAAQILFLIIIILNNGVGCEENAVTACYDRQGNEIIGQSCIQEQHLCFSGAAKIVIILVASALFLIVNYFFTKSLEVIKI